MNMFKNKRILPSLLLATMLTQSVLPVSAKDTDSSSDKAEEMASNSEMMNESDENMMLAEQERVMAEEASESDSSEEITETADEYGIISKEILGEQEFFDEEYNVVSEEADEEQELTDNKMLEKELSNAETDISLFGVMPENAELSIETDNNAVSLLEDAGFITDDQTVLSSYDIKITDGEEKYQPVEYGESLELNLGHVNTDLYSDICVYHVDDDGNMEEVSSYINDDGELIATAESFSSYTTVANKAKNLEATLKTGREFNIAIKKLVDSSVRQPRSEDTTITNIKWSDSSFEDGITIQKSGTPVYAKLDTDGTTVLLYTDAESVFLNSNCSSMFERFEALADLDMLDTKIDTSNVTNFSSFFSLCKNLKAVNLKSFSTSKANNMTGMFSGCSSLEELDVSGFNTSNVNIFSDMFSACSSLKNIDVSGFDTSKGIYFGNMFDYCVSLTDLDVSSFDTRGTYDDDDFNGHFFEGCDNIVTFKAPKLMKDAFSLPTYFISDIEKKWYRLDEEGNVIDKVIAVTLNNVNQSYTYVVKEDPTYYSVTFNAGEGFETKIERVEEKGLLDVPEIPEKEGYTFTGWYKDEACEEEWSFTEDTVVADTVLYAGWEKVASESTENTENTEDKIPESADVDAEAETKTETEDVSEAETIKDIKEPENKNIPEPEQDKDPEESPENTIYNNVRYHKILMRADVKTETKTKLTWKKVNGADGYLIYLTGCGKNVLKDNLYKTVKKGSKTTLMLKNLEKGEHYKAMVKAYKIKNGKKVVLTSSYSAHWIQGDYDKDSTNTKSITLKSKKILKMSVGNTSKIKAKFNGYDSNKEIFWKHHMTKEYRYFSYDTKIATVSKSGKIKAVKKGTTKVAVVAPNGKWKLIKIKVQ